MYRRCAIILAFLMGLMAAAGITTGVVLLISNIVMFCEGLWGGVLGRSDQWFFAPGVVAGIIYGTIWARSEAKFQREEYWTTHGRCKHCGYQLRRLGEPQCPECGYWFKDPRHDIRDLTDGP